MGYVEDGALEQVTKAKNLPRVFLIGDSIRIGYCKTVRTRLEGKAEVLFPDDNCRFSQYILTCLHGWKHMYDGESIDLVLFNSGHWDVAHWNGDEKPLNNVEVYAENIGRIIDMIRRLYPAAKVAFLTTTPMNPDGSQGVNPRTTEEIAVRNAAACAVCKQKDTPVLDLFDYMKDWDSTMYRDYCHLTDKGFQLLGTYVASFAERLLSENERDRSCGK